MHTRDICVPVYSMMKMGGYKKANIQMFWQMIKGWVVALQYVVRTSSSEKAAMSAACQKNVPYRLRGGVASENSVKI